MSGSQSVFKQTCHLHRIEAKTVTSCVQDKSPLRQILFKIQMHIQAAFTPERFKIVRFYRNFVQVTNVKSRKPPVISPKEAHVLF